MANKLKMHALRPVPYETSINWTLCQRDVDRNQIAAFEEGVTCKNCRNIIDFNNAWEAERKAKQHADQERLGKQLLGAFKEEN